MPTLHINFRAKSLLMQSCDEEPAPAGCIIVDNARSIKDAEQRLVCVGTVSQEVCGVPAGQVVLKFATGSPGLEDLEAEYSFYCNQLKNLQGKYVPHCYGMFKTRKPDGTPFKCIVLEHGGRPVNRPRGFMSLTIYERAAVWTALNKVHRAGLQHNDFEERNVLFDASKPDRGPYIVDFEHATTHNCQRRIKVREGDLAPQRWHFKCDELWYAAMDMQIWRPAEIPFFNIIILEEMIGSAEDIIRLARARVPLPEADIRYKAEKVWGRIKRWRENGGIRPRHDAENLSSDEEPEDDGCGDDDAVDYNDLEEAEAAAAEAEDEEDDDDDDDDSDDEE